jgi:hypothetical protein
MANFGARLAYPIPERIVNRRLEGREAAVRAALDPWSPLRAAIARSVRALMNSLLGDRNGADERARPLGSHARSNTGSRRVA